MPATKEPSPLPETVTPEASSLPLRRVKVLPSVTFAIAPTMSAVADSLPLWAAELLGADTIVIHSGSAAKISREEAMALSCDTLAHVAEAVGNTPIRLGIETMGKVNQLGTLSEVIEQCKVAPIYAPVVDFGHLNARNIGGAFPNVDSYRRVFNEIGEKLGDRFAKDLHCHFSKIEYTGAGEKRHLTFADDVFGPVFEPLAEAIVREGVTPRIICESAGTQAEDALYMKNAYMSAMEHKH